MGTNFYWYEKPPCECCKREYEPKHICMFTTMKELERLQTGLAAGLMAL